MFVQLILRPNPRLVATTFTKRCRHSVRIDGGTVLPAPPRGIFEENNVSHVANDSDGGQFAGLQLYLVMSFTITVLNYRRRRRRRRTVTFELFVGTVQPLPAVLRFETFGSRQEVSQSGGLYHWQGGSVPSKEILRRVWIRTG